MKRFKGTKGEWAVKHSESKTAFNIIGTRIGEKYKIARCPCLIIEGSEHFNAREKNQANADAQLIATAPELLEALIAMINIVDDTVGLIGWHRNGDIAYWDEFVDVDIARDVINKALGQ